MSAPSPGAVDPDAVVRAVDLLVDLVGSTEVAAAWERESALPGMTVGGLTRHLVSQPECAVEFLTTPGPPDAETVALASYFDRVDWLGAPVDAPENTSIRDDFNEMAAPGHAESVAILERSRAALAAAIDGAGETTYVPWQDCALALDDFLRCRLLEIVVHADDLAVSVGRADPDVRARPCSSPCWGCCLAGGAPPRPGRRAADPGPRRAVARRRLGVLTRRPASARRPRPPGSIRSRTVR